MRLSSHDHGLISDALLEVYKLQDLDMFTSTAMRVLPPLVDSELTSYNEVNFDARRMLTLLDSSTAQSMYHDRQPDFEQLMHQNPLIEHSAKIRDTPKKISDFVTLKQWREREIYREFYGRLNVNHQMGLVLMLKTSVIVAFAFNRSKGDFTERHRALLTALQPHLTQAYENAWLFTQTRTTLQSREDMLEAVGAGWVDLNDDMTIKQASSSARQSLRSMFDVSVNDESKLPPILEDWLALQNNAAQMGKPSTPYVAENRQGRIIARLVPSQDGGGLSVMFERFTRATSPEMLEHLGLTERQAVVLFWLSQGKSNAEIAIILKISVRTVENHVYQIFDVLAVSNRTEAANVALGVLLTRS